MRIRGIIVNCQMIHENKCISLLFCFILKLTFQVSLRSMLRRCPYKYCCWRKKTNFHELNAIRKENPFPQRTLHTVVKQSCSTKRHDKIIFLRLQQKIRRCEICAGLFLYFTENSGFNLKRIKEKDQNLNTKADYILASMT